MDEFATESSAPAPPEDARTIARARIRRILGSPELAPIQTEFGRTPVYALFGGAAFYLLAEYAVRRGYATNGRPGLYKLAGFLIGGFCGAQVGLYRMRSLYQRQDPTGKLRNELEMLFRASRGEGPLPPDPADNTTDNSNNSNNNSNEEML